MSRLDWGRWKLVSSAPTRRKSKPGEMKMSVEPEWGWIGLSPAAKRGSFESADDGGADGDDAAYAQLRRD